MSIPATIPPYRSRKGLLGLLLTEPPATFVIDGMYWADYVASGGGWFEQQVTPAPSSLWGQYNKVRSELLPFVRQDRDFGVNPTGNSVFTNVSVIEYDIPPPPSGNWPEWLDANPSGIIQARWQITSGYTNKYWDPQHNPQKGYTVTRRAFRHIVIRDPYNTPTPAYGDTDAVSWTKTFDESDNPYVVNQSTGDALGYKHGYTDWYPAFVAQRKPDNQVKLTTYVYNGDQYPPDASPRPVDPPVFPIWFISDSGRPSFAVS